MPESHRPSPDVVAAVQRYRATHEPPPQPSARFLRALSARLFSTRDDHEDAPATPAPFAAKD